MGVGKGRLAGLTAAAMATIMVSAGSALAIGGGSTAVTEGAYRFSAKIEIGANVRSCSGALISERWLLTAKQCFAENTTPGAPAHPAKATIGKTSLSASPGEVVDIVHVIPRDDRDLALVELARPVTIPGAGIVRTPAAAGEQLRITGYGRTSTEWVPDRLHSGAFTVQSLTPTTFAVEGIAPEQPTICRGDAGGPVFRDSNGAPELVGIASRSWQGGCLGETETRRGGVATRYDDIIPWIQTHQIDPVATGTSKAIVVRWNQPAVPVSAPSFKLYGSTDPAVPIGPSTLLAGPGRITSFTHLGIKPGQTWHYKVVMVDLGGADGPTSGVVSATAKRVLPSDFDGDGKEDIATFLRGPGGNPASGDVYVSRSKGNAFIDDDARWHDGFAFDSQVPLSGDFNGDGRADIAAFTLGSSGDVWVSLSTGTGFQGATLWQGDFGYRAEVPVVGDFNGDGKDDVAVFLRTTVGEPWAGDVYVALSNGTTFDSSSKWHEFFGAGGEIPAAGDFNGDGKDDVALFRRGGLGDPQRGDVYVALSNGSSAFVNTPNGNKWHDWFSIDGELPGVGDFNGDGKDDIVSFRRGGTGDAQRGDVYVAVSDGAKFVNTSATNKWHDWFGIDNELPGVGDFNGDGKDDVIVFTQGAGGDVYVTVSQGDRFEGNGTAPPWHELFAPGSEVPVPRLIS